MDIIEAIQAATLKVDDRYFRLSVAGRSPLSRERVYCYELYHQLRVALSSTNLTLTAEPDKRGNPDFDKSKKPNPDLILHHPGSHENNNAVIEVECTPDKRHLVKDLRTLKLMQSKGYKYLILLLFNVSQVPWRRVKLAAAEAELNLTDVTVILHSAVGQSATLEEIAVVPEA